MIKMTEQNKKPPVHNIILEGRSRLSISGITDVDHFDENTVSLYTQMGEMTVTGKDLHVNDMSVQTGEMNVEGDIWAISYGDRDRHSPLSFLGKLFR